MIFCRKASGTGFPPGDSIARPAGEVKICLRYRHDKRMNVFHN